MKKLVLTLVLVSLFSISAYADNYAITEHVEVPDSDAWAFGSDDFTITGWAKFNSYNSIGATFLSQGTLDNISRWYIETTNSIAGGHHQFTEYNGSPIPDVYKVESAHMTALNTWYHLAVVRSGNSISLFQDGTELGSATSTTGSVANHTGSLLIGTQIFQKPFNGQIDEIGIWNYAMTEEQLNFWMYHSPIGPESGLIAYWDFNEGSGSIIHDISGNGHDGLFLTQPGWVSSDSPVSPVPEPSSLLLMGFGGIITAFIKRKRKA